MLTRLRCTVFATLLLVLSFSSVAAAQPLETDSEFTSQLNGAVISLGSSGDLTLLPDEYDLIESGGFAEEFVWFTGGYSNYELILVSGDVTAEEYMDVTLGNMIDFYESFETVDSAADVTSSWFIGNAVLDGDPMVVYFEYEMDAFGDIDLGYMQFAYADTLADDMYLAQDNVTIDGEGILQNTDPRAVASLVAPEGDATPDATNTTEAGGTTRTTRTTRTSATPEAVDNGLVSDSEWQSPTFGSTVTWDTADWEFPVGSEYGIVIDPDGYDILTLQTTDGMGYVFVTLDQQYDYTPQNTVEYWMSDEVLELRNNATVLDSATTATTASVVLKTVDSADLDIVIVMEVSFEADGTAVYSEVTAAPETIADVYGQYQDGVQLDGASFNLTWSPEEIADIVGE